MKSWSVTQEFAKAAAYLCDLRRWLLQDGGFGLLQLCSPTFLIWLTIVDLLYYSEKLRPGEGHLMSIQYMIFQLQKVLLFLTKYENVKKCSYKSPFVINIINLGVSSQMCVLFPGFRFDVPYSDIPVLHLRWGLDVHPFFPSFSLVLAVLLYLSSLSTEGW